MRAILLAAGMGTRLRPLTLKTPKSQVKVNGTPMIERQIEFLKARGVNEIVIVTGYLHEKFEYLKTKYGVQLIHNKQFDAYNNIYSMYLAKDYLGDSFVIDADIYLHHNFIPEAIDKSVYFSGYKTDFTNEWMIEYDEDTKRVNDIVVGNGDGHILCGMSYWNEDDAKIIKEKLEEAIDTRDFKDLYWDNIIMENIKDLNVYLYEIKSDDSFEIDSLEDLNQVNEYLKNKNC